MTQHIITAMLGGLLLVGCGGDGDGDGGGDGAGDQDGAVTELDGSAESDAESAPDDAIGVADGEPLVDPCADKEALRIELWTAALACTADEQCTKNYLGPEPCGCPVYVNADAALDDLFAVDAELRAECVAEVACPAVECPIGTASCDAGLCVTTYE